MIGSAPLLATALAGGATWPAATALAGAVLVAGAAVLVAGGAVLWRRRCSLVAQAVHEIRGPLQAALLGLHGLGGDGARLAAIELELRRAGRAAEDLSAAAAGRRAPDAASEVDLAGLLADAGVAWELLAAHRGVGLAVERPAVPITVRGDRERIAQALGNLVANAVEHGGGDVRVRARVAEGRARVEVTDGGPGLPAPLPELVAAARGRRGRRGHGIGLASAIAHRHGGRLATAPSPRGARLVFEVPLAGARRDVRRHRSARSRALPRSLRRLPLAALPAMRRRRGVAPVVPLRGHHEVAPAARRSR